MIPLPLGEYREFRLLEARARMAFLQGPVFEAPIREGMAAARRNRRGFPAPALAFLRAEAKALARRRRLG